MFPDKLMLNSTSAYYGRVLDCEIEARAVVQKALKNSGEDIRDLLGKFMIEFCGQVRSSTGIQDPDNILCTSLVDFFVEYKVEFGIDITNVEVKKRTLRCALQQLDSFLSANHYSKKGPGYSNRTANIIAASQQSVNVILRAVRKFLIEKASEKIHEAPAADRTLPRNVAVTAPNTDIKPRNLGGNSLLTGTRSSPGHIAIRNAGPSIGNENKAEIGVALEKRTESTSMETKSESSLKRKRSDSSSEPPIFQNFIHDAKNMQALCQDQEQEISQLKSTQQDSKRLAQELAASQTEVRHLKEEARSQQCSIDELKGAKLEAESARERAATATASMEKMKREAAFDRLQKTRLETRLKNANEKIFGHEEKVRKAEEEREHAKNDTQETVDLKNAMREMLMVTGAGFKLDAIEIAAKAITNGKNPRSVVADMIRDGVA